MMKPQRFVERSNRSRVARKEQSGTSPCGFWPGSPSFPRLRDDRYGRLVERMEEDTRCDTLGGA